MHVQIRADSSHIASDACATCKEDTISLEWSKTPETVASIVSAQAREKLPHGYILLDISERQRLHPDQSWLMKADAINS